MDPFESLISTQELKTGLLTEVSERNHAELNFRYDADYDALYILFVSLDTPRTVHPVDDAVSLFFNPDNREVVGIMIENFEYDFVICQKGAIRVWRLSESGLYLHNGKGLCFEFECLEPDRCVNVQVNTQPAVDLTDGDTCDTTIFSHKIQMA